jgi:hypothetical protein
MDLLDIVTNNFKHNIKRSLIIKEMKQYALEEFKIKKKGNSYEVYVKKTNSKKKLKKIYEFKTYKNNISKKRNYDNNGIEELISPFKKLKTN